MSSCRRWLSMLLVTLMVGGLCLAAPVAADNDQCSPPGVDSASALPTNLAAAAKGPTKTPTPRRR